MYSDSYLTIVVPSHPGGAGQKPVHHSSNKQQHPPQTVNTVLTVPINSPEEIGTQKLKAEGAVINPELMILALRGGMLFLLLYVSSEFREMILMECMQLARQYRFIT